MNFTVARAAVGSLGNYIITYTTAYPNSSYVIATTATGNTSDAGVGSQHDTTKAHVYSWVTNTGALFDRDVSSLSFSCSTMVYMLGVIVDWLWQYCCGFRRRKRSKLNDALHVIEGLTEDEVVKLVKYFDRIKCCQSRSFSLTQTKR